MVAEQRLNLDQELAELTDLTTRAVWTQQEVARVQEQLPKMLHDLRHHYAQRRKVRGEVEVEAERDAARAEVEMLRGVGCGEPSFIGAEIPDEPCGACLKCARRERDAARAEVDRRTDWYQQRFNALRAWVKREVEPFSTAVATGYWNIVANGSPSPHESADWAGTMHAANLRADIAEGRLRAEIAAHAETKTEVERLREAARQVHALADEAVSGTVIWGSLVEIHKITKGMVAPHAD